MTTTASDPHIAPYQPAAAPALRAADQGVADALESVLSDNTRRVYGAQWRIFTGWCDSVDLRALPADPLTVARYLAVAGQERHQRLGDLIDQPGGGRVEYLLVADEVHQALHQVIGAEQDLDPVVLCAELDVGVRLHVRENEYGDHEHLTA